MTVRYTTHPTLALALLASFGLVARSAVAQAPSPPQAPAEAPADRAGDAAGLQDAEAVDTEQQNDTATGPHAVTPPRLIEFVEAQRVRESNALTAPVEILLELTVQTDGSVTDVVVLEASEGALGTAAAQAATKFRFAPAMQGKAPLAVRIQYRYVFDPPPPEVRAEPPVPSTGVSESSSPHATRTGPKSLGPSGSLHGRVTERGTRKPVLGATVILPDLGRETLTDAQGRFQFEELPVGRVRLLIEDADHQRVDDTESVAKDQRTEVVYAVDQTGFGQDDLIAVGQHTKKEVTRHAMSAREIETVPGSNGDPLKAIQNLPGVARTTDDRIVLRGGGDTKVFVNGLPLPAAFHFFGLRSTLGSGLLESIDVKPGNYGAEHGRGNGGVVDIKLKRPAEDGLHGFGQVDLFDASAFLEGPISDNGTFAVGVRRSYIDTLLPLLLDEDGKRMFQAAPRYYDGQAVYDYKTKKHRFRAALLGSSDSMELLFEEPVETDPALRGGVSYNQRWVTGQVLWDYKLSSKTEHSLAASYLTGFSEQRVADARIEFTPNLFALRETLTHHTSDWLTLRGGLDLQADYYDFDVDVAPLPKEGQIPAPLSTRDRLRASGDATTVKPAIWAAGDLQLGQVLLVPSLRLDYYSFANKLDGTLAIQPRFDARWAITSSTALKGGVGAYSEAADLDETNEVFGNPLSEPDLSTHYSAGIEQRLGDAVTVDVTGFYKHLYNMLSPVDDPELRYENSGTGRAYGAELLLRHDLRSRFYGWLAYTLMRSERKDAGASTYRLFDNDQTHNVTAVAQYRLSPTWELGARFRYVTGNPSTPVIGATYDSDADTYVADYGAHNSRRLGAFHQLDVRLDKHFVFDSWKLTAYLDVQNAYGRQNPEGINYNYDFSESNTAGGLPLIPSFGAKGEF
jgi:TonB family protein